MNIIKTEIPDVLIIEPKIFGDARGFFYESLLATKDEARKFLAEAEVFF